MNIKILHMIEGAKNATGTAVIIDVFRAFSVEAYFLAGGAKKIIPVSDTSLAYRLKEENSDWILCGERGGKILPGFDVGNSPSQLKELDLKGKTVVHTTSAGTQGIANAKGATDILGGSLVNAKATAEYIKKSGATDISLVCMGLSGISKTEEDTLCARYIKALLEGETLDMRAEIENLRFTSGAKFFDPTQAEVFPQPDFEMCTQLDKFDFIMRLNKTSDELDFMEKYKPLKMVK